MGDTVFINRVAERKLLAEEFVHKPNTSRFISIGGPTGRGKTSLVNIVVTEKNILNFVRIKTMDHEKFRGHEGYFLREVGRGLDRFARNDGNNLDANTKGVIDKTINTARLAFVEYVKKLSGSKALSDSVSKLLNNQDFDTIFSGHDELNQPIKNYIGAFLKNTPFTVILENIQNIDKESLEFFRDLLSKNKKLQLIVEYTDSDKGIYKERELFDYLASTASYCSRHRLDILPVSDIVDFLKQDRKALVSVFESNYIASEGNLYKLSFTLESTDKSNILSSSIDASFLESLNTLSEQNKFLIALVASHGSSISESLFREAVNSNSRAIGMQYRDLKTAVASDELNHFLKLDREEITLAHDSLLKEILSSERFVRHLLLANDIWLKLYLSIKEESFDDFLLPRAELLGWELYFRSQLEKIGGIEETLGEVYRLCLKSRVPKKIIYFAENIRQRISLSPTSSCKVVEKIDIYLSRIFYRLGMYDRVIEYCLPHIENAEMRLICATSYLLSGSPTKAEEMTNEILRESRTEDLKWLGSNLVKIAILRASNRYQECTELWIYLHERGYFENTCLEALFLRSSDMALIGFEERRNQYLLQAIEHFKQSNDVIQEMNTRIALCQHLGYEGKLDDAQEQLEIAKKITQETFTNHYVLNNNFAVISLFRGEASDESADLLEMASESCDNHLDKLIILNNLLIWHAMNNAIDNIQQIQIGIEEIIKSHTELDYDLTRIALFNIAMSCEQSSLKEHYLRKARDLPLIADHKFWNAKLNNDNEYGYDDFRLNHNFYPVFISNWSLDFDIALQH